MAPLPNLAESMQAVMLMKPDELIGYLSTQGLKLNQEEEVYLKLEEIGGTAFVIAMRDQDLRQDLRSYLRLGTVCTMMYSYESLCSRKFSH